MNTLSHQQHQLSEVRLGDHSGREFARRTSIEVYCHRHPDKIVIQGCAVENCSKMIMCQQCNFDDRTHVEEHRDQIVTLEEFLKILSSEIKKVNRKDSMLYNENVKYVLENEHTILVKYDNLCKAQTKKFIQFIDVQISKIIEQLQIFKQRIEAFFEKQFNIFNGNLHFFKNQYQQMNPEDTLHMFSDSSSIIAKMYSKTSHQVFQFLSNLRKSANMEGSLLSDLDYISRTLIENSRDEQFLLKDYCYSELQRSIEDMLAYSKEILHDSMRSIPQINKEIHSEIVSSSFISLDRNKIKLATNYLFDSIKFQFRNVSQIQTHHTNSVSAVVVINEDMAATSSYDRSIKIWRLSTGKVIKHILDICCISSMILFSFKNQKHSQQYYSEEANHLLKDIKILSDAGLYLISGGFDKQVKIWDFDLTETTTQYSLTESSILSQPYQMSIFPLKVLKGHNGWVTALTSLNDEKNIVAADDSGELIIWDIINSTLMYRLSHSPNIVPFIQLTIPYTQFVSSSSTILRVYQLYYRTEQSFEEKKFKERLADRFGPKRIDQVSPQLSNCNLQREIDIGWGIHGCLSTSNSNVLIVYGSQPNRMAYVLLDQKREIEMRTDWVTYVGHMILIEKNNYPPDQFYKNINLIVCGDKSLGLYDGYGRLLRAIDAHEDLFASSTLCQRNMQVISLKKVAQKRILRLLCASQFETQAYLYKSSRITILELQFDA